MVANGGTMSTQIGIAAYLRNLAVRCNKIARRCSDPSTQDALAAICVELTDKAEVLESAFQVPKEPAWPTADSATAAGGPPVPKESAT